MCADLVLRRGTPDDSRSAFDLSMAAVRDLFARQNHPLRLDPEAFWAVLQPYLSHLAAHAAEWWIAEDPSDGSLVGHARSVERKGLFELSELFVKPGFQSAGVGKTLIERAFPMGRGEVRLVLATNDVRALARYYAADTAARFGVASLAAAPKPAEHESGVDEINFQVPTVNTIAMNHLLGRSFKIDAPLNLFMSNREFGRFDRFVAFGPPIVL